MKIKHLLGLDGDTITGGKYFLINLLLPLLIPILSGVISGLTPLIFLWFIPQVNSDYLVTLVFNILFLLGLVLILYVLIRTTRKRLRTIGMNQNWFWIMFVPLVNVVFLLYLAITDGRPKVQS
ncbi:MAG TPA: hypothetical protein VG934_00840 [Candidatus Paceibacterota bacterium]|nr:hypothetical protein [Candidatus Paceibacterota bacterium]